MRPLLCINLNDDDDDDTKRTKKYGKMSTGPMKEMSLTLGAKAIKRTDRAAHAINRANKAIQAKQRYKPVK